MTVQPSDLRKIPLFQSITDAHLSELMGVASSIRFAIGPSSPSCPEATR